MSKKDGGPAFPIELSVQHSICMKDEYNGLTKREYFAAVALQGLLANPKVHSGPVLGTDKKRRIIAEMREYADLALRQLAKGGEDE